MVKNKLESLFSKAMRDDNYFWGMKLHNNMLAHQTTPADYILSCERNLNPIVMLVECKQVTCEDGQGRFAFKRLKQLHDLLSFESLKSFHESYLCLGYYDKTWTNSDVFIVPIKIFDEIIKKHSAKSLNRKDAVLLLSDYRANTKKGGLDLWQLK